MVHGVPAPLLAFIDQVPTITPEALAFFKDAAAGTFGPPSVCLAAFIPGTPTARVVAAGIAGKIPPQYPIGVFDDEAKALAWLTENHQAHCTPE
jgi:hypothetical protein